SDSVSPWTRTMTYVQPSMPGRSSNVVELDDNRHLRQERMYIELRCVIDNKMVPQIAACASDRAPNDHESGLSLLRGSSVVARSSLRAAPRRSHPPTPPLFSSFVRSMECRVPICNM